MPHLHCNPGNRASRKTTAINRTNKMEIAKDWIKNQDEISTPSCSEIQKCIARKINFDAVLGTMTLGALQHRCR